MQEYSSIQSLLFLSTKQTSSNKAAKNVASELHKTTFEPITISAAMTSTRLQQHSTAIFKCTRTESKRWTEKRKKEKEATVT